MRRVWLSINSYRNNNYLSSDAYALWLLLVMLVVHNQLAKSCELPLKYDILFYNITVVATLLNLIGLSLSPLCWYNFRKIGAGKHNAIIIGEISNIIIN